MNSVIHNPSMKMFQIAEHLQTPCLIYDLPGIIHTIRCYQSDIKNIPSAKLNVALKACYVPEVLKCISSLGVGVDAASPYEYEYAKRFGFPEISATGPSFTGSFFSKLLKENTILDVCSKEQLSNYCKMLPGEKVGLRIRVHYPERLQDNTTFSDNSRFGVSITDPEVHQILKRYDMNLSRIHFHLGQLNSSRLNYLMHYIVEIVNVIDTITTIDFGGGFYSLYANRNQALASFRNIQTQLSNLKLKIRFEPGGAVFGPNGYLVTTIQSIELHHSYYKKDIIQVDSSAWNFAPWIVPKAFSLKEAYKPTRTKEAIIAGNTLYEEDMFGNPKQYKFPVVEVPQNTVVGDKLVITNCGAYTSTNERKFNMLKAIPIYIFDGTQIYRSID